MRRENGAANVRIVEAAAAAGVRRFGYVSAEFIAPVDHPRLLGGYYAGKRDAESAVAAHFERRLHRAPARRLRRAARRQRDAAARRRLRADGRRLLDAARPCARRRDRPARLAARAARPRRRRRPRRDRASPRRRGRRRRGRRRRRRRRARLSSRARRRSRRRRRARAPSRARATSRSSGTARVLCQREIAYYKSIDRAGAVNWVDCHADPSVLAPYGVTYEQAMARIHAAERTPEGGERRRRSCRTASTPSWLCGGACRTGPCCRRSSLRRRARCRRRRRRTKCGARAAAHHRARARRRHGM